jgi:hypothetical protein
MSSVTSWPSNAPRRSGFAFSLGVDTILLTSMRERRIRICAPRVETARYTEAETIAKPYQKREKKAVHTLSFHSAKLAQRRENKWYATLPTFLHPQASRFSSCWVGRNGPGTCNAGVGQRSVRIIRPPSICSQICSQNLKNMVNMGNMVRVWSTGASRCVYVSY